MSNTFTFEVDLCCVTGTLTVTTSEDFYIE